MSGKGSTQRPRQVSRDELARNWARTYGPKPEAEHPDYKTEHPDDVKPRADIGCTLAGPGRGDCEHFVGRPGESRPGMHDGPDDTVDHYGRPNGWCFYCWVSSKLLRAEAEIRRIHRGVVSKHQPPDPLDDAVLNAAVCDALAIVLPK